MGLVFVAILDDWHTSKSLINPTIKVKVIRSLPPSKRAVLPGMITDHNNMPLAISAPLTSAYFSPHDYALEYYELKARQQELQKSKPE